MWTYLVRRSHQGGTLDVVPSCGSLPDTFTLSDEIQYRILRELAQSQQVLAEALGVSVGKINYCLRALADKGPVTVENFRTGVNKMAYPYKLTPRGILGTARETYRFLQLERQEFEALRT